MHDNEDIPIHRKLNTPGGRHELTEAWQRATPSHGSLGTHSPARSMATASNGSARTDVCPYASANA